MKNWFSPLLIATACLFFFGKSQAQQTHKPWTYWWWMGSAVNETDIQHQLEGFAAAGLGGVHIIPIYGVKGYEEQFIPFLSEEWLEIVAFTIEKANELNLGVDMTLGTGWPFGGSWMDKNNAAKRLLSLTYNFPQTSQLNIQLDTVLSNNNWLGMVTLFAKSKTGEVVNLSSELSKNRIIQKVKKGDWTLYCYGVANTRQQVKRAAPGGEGLVMDYFDSTAVATYLHQFDSVFAHTAHPIAPRAFYHDSYEAFGADWSTDFIEKFEELRGYDLRSVFPVFQEENEEGRAHILHDIRQTLSELLYTDFAKQWTDWSREQGKLTRLQAHGSPGNILDLYALADIPETEAFGCSNFSIPGLQCDPDYEEDRFGKPSPLMMKFASSPAHLLGKPLVSSETATWLANHFKVSLAQVKPQVDELLVAGINHIFYHGTTYSPQEADYPGWLFYASTNFGPTAHFKDEFPLLNDYIAQSQQLLQAAKPANDVLLYFPIDELWTDYPGNIYLPLDVHKYSRWFEQTEFGKTAQTLWDNGVGFDYISDRQLAQLQVDAEGQLAITEAQYATIIVPKIKVIEESTLANLAALAEKGATIFFVEQLPQHFAGYQSFSQTNSKMPVLQKRLSEQKNVTISDDFIPALRQKGIRQEALKRKGLDFIRKRSEDGYLYFVSNLSNQFYEDSVALSVDYEFVERFDPQTGKKGFIQTSDSFWLQLPPGKSCFIQTYTEQPDSELWQFLAKADTTTLDTEWQVRFIFGNSEDLQQAYTIDTLRSWTDWGDEQLGYFSGKASYTTTFRLANPGDNPYLLAFDDIHETAQVIINGVEVGTIWALPYQLEIPAGVLKRENTMEIIVQNLSANQMRQVDQSGRDWKKFYDINIVDIQYKPFDASNWAPELSGLVGEVWLIGKR